MDIDVIERRVGQALAAANEAKTTAGALAGTVDGFRSLINEAHTAARNATNTVEPLMSRLTPILEQIGPLQHVLPKLQEIEAEFAKIGPLLEEIRSFKERFEPLLSALQRMHGAAPTPPPIAPDTASAPQQG